MRVWIVVEEFEVLILEVENILHFRVEAHLRKRTRFACELQIGLLHVVQVEVSVARSVNKFAGLKSANLCHHKKEERVRGYVERHPEEAVGRALIELQRKASASSDAPQP